MMLHREQLHRILLAMFPPKEGKKRRTGGKNKLHPGNNQDLEMYGHFLECDLENNIFRGPRSKIFRNRGDLDQTSI
jgi:hypothetical protein